MQNNYFEELSIQWLLDNPIGAQLKEGLEIVEKIEQNLYVMATKKESDELLKQKIGTALIFAVIEKAKLGKNPKEFSNDDWKEIAYAVSELAIVGGEEKYSVFVFLKYAEYIDWSIASYGELFSKQTNTMISECSKELRHKTKQLENGEIKEVNYIEDCLWISLDAMTKLLSAYIGVVGGKEVSDFTRAIGMISFEYARYSMYKKELEIVSNYLEQQAELDEELDKNFELFKTNLTDKTNQFEECIGNAFSKDVRERLQGSWDLAKSAGVAENELLKEMKDIDDFFA